MTNAKTNSSNLHSLFHPAAHYASPDAVLNDETLSAPEKRIILSSWASDMYANPVPRCAKYPAWGAPSGSPTSSRRCVASTAKTTVRPARAGLRDGCGGLGPPPGGGLGDVH
ncbi:hypothetical protein ABIB94_008193 [Bradyrhizobium sp. JR7.2]|uniref:Uncharacterized protein n=1 Tax=Bradyrhizobium barranii TaxID=2992140 RepID=A0ABY3R1T4_9BRAD|nr:MULTISPECIES: hypothetical protein [Bradyrhizobium]UFW91873.1 hypothetical protein BjapCC829_46535 [Bradyrhizobium japonicum]WFU00400.1 hypothetical protein QA633_47310 [Bradyrhizobium barranii]